MKIYVSDKEKDYYITYGNGYEALELNKREPINIISLEPHEEEVRKQERQKVIAELEKANKTAVKELLREFTDKLKDKIINENTNEQGNLDYNVDLTGLLDDINELLKERGVE